MTPFHLDNQAVEIVHQVVVLRPDRPPSTAMPADRFGFELPLLLAAAGFRTLIDGLHDQLAARGHPDAGPIHAFALQAIGPDGATVSELGRRLGVSKQAAARPPLASNASPTSSASRTPPTLAPSHCAAVHAARNCSRSAPRSSNTSATIGNANSAPTASEHSRTTSSRSPAPPPQSSETSLAGCAERYRRPKRTGPATH